ncbi:hypothetical protein [Cohnella massiliensis]|uniref:hypothetical protein n=1 Tax=Cohnella massiliensis TaxID=1816691 RepID=UPI00111B4E4C|nr:hypothetical protein [Cohnella massiliensis]
MKARARKSLAASSGKPKTGRAAGKPFAKTSSRSGLAGKRGARGARKRPGGLRAAKRRDGSRRTHAAGSVRRRKPPKRSALLAGLWKEGRDDGADWRAGHPEAADVAMNEAVRKTWMQKLQEHANLPKLDGKAIWERAKAYAEGFAAGAGMAPSRVPLPLSRSAGAVVYANANPDALRSVLKELARLPLAEIVVVLGSPSERLLEAARSGGTATIACLPEDVHPDIGRALGAKLTDADLLLIADGEQKAEASELARLLWAVDGRLDVALNDRSAFLGLFHKRSDVERFHEFLNVTLNRPDLQMNTMAALPLAMTRKALETLGAAELSVPVKAHAKALQRGLAVGTAAAVDWRPPAMPNRDRIARGDHLEAWKMAFAEAGFRLRFPDKARNRKAAKGAVG